MNGYKITFAYSPTSQRTNMVDASGTNSYVYDLRERLRTNTTPQGTLFYSYDDFGNLAALQSSTANGVNLSYRYDVLNRLTNVLDLAIGATNTYAFDPIGNLQTVRYHNGVTNRYTYDALNRLTNLVAGTPSTSLASFAYKLALAGNRTNLAEIVSGTSRTNQWSYDALYRLTNEVLIAASGGTISYKYDGVGNRTNRTSTVGSVANQSFTYNSNDQLSSDVYDSNGNTRTNGSNAFFYDPENRLTNATVSGTSITIVYDGDGNRVRKIVGATTNTYLVDGQNPSGFAQVLEEKSNGTLTKVYCYGLDLILQRDVSSGAVYYFGYDANGNTRFLTTTNASVANVFAYDAFGTLIASNAAPQTDYLFAGEQNDGNLGLSYLRARYLNTGTGRFWSRDSFAGYQDDPLSLHRYQYVANNPVNRIDPSGQEYSLGGALTVISGSFILAQISNPATASAQKKFGDFLAIERQPASKFTLSARGLQLIATFEDFSPAIYKDAAKLDTIGFGHRVLSGEYQKFANGITREQGLTLLRSDARIAENAVRSAVTVALNQDEFDALVSFTFNVGAGAFRGSTLLKKLNTGDYDGASDEFPRWNRAGGNVVPGLTERRRKERIFFRGELWLYRSELGFDAP